MPVGFSRLTTCTLTQKESVRVRAVTTTRLAYTQPSSGRGDPRLVHLLEVDAIYPN